MAGVYFYDITFRETLETPRNSRKLDCAQISCHTVFCVEYGEFMSSPFVITCAVHIATVSFNILIFMQDLHFTGGAM